MGVVAQIWGCEVDCFVFLAKCDILNVQTDQGALMPTSLQGGLGGQEQGPDPWASVPSPCIARDVHSAIDKSYGQLLRLTLFWHMLHL